MRTWLHRSKSRSSLRENPTARTGTGLDVGLSERRGKNEERRLTSVIVGRTVLDPDAIRRSGDHAEHDRSPRRYRRSVLVLTEKEIYGHRARDRVSDRTCNRTAQRPWLTDDEYNSGDAVDRDVDPGGDPQ